MATGGEKKVDYETLTLEKTQETPFYSFIAVCEDKIIVIDGIVWKVRLHRLNDGKFLATTIRLESVPRDMCLMNEMDICLIHGNGLIKLMSIDDTDMSRALTTTRTLHVQGVLERYDAVVKFKEDIVVTGVKRDTMYWCIVSLNDGHVDTVHQICNGSRRSYVTTKDNMIYISCCAGDQYPDNTGVYGFDILNPSQCKYTYKHQHLQNPRSIVINEDDYIFVLNHDECIHQLTATCQLVFIFRQEIPSGFQTIFWNHGCLYVTHYGSHDITILRPVYQDPVIIPVEILRMDDKSVHLYKEALRDGKEKVYNIRVMVVGQYGVGKTTLTKRLLGQQVDISERKSTEGIDVHKHCCKIALDTGEWIMQHEESDQLFRLQRLVKLLTGQAERPEDSGQQKGHTEVINQEVIYPRETTPDELHNPSICSDSNDDDTSADIEVIYKNNLSHSSESDIDEVIEDTSGDRVVIYRNDLSDFSDSDIDEVAEAKSVTIQESEKEITIDQEIDITKTQQQGLSSDKRHPALKTSGTTFQESNHPVTNKDGVMMEFLQMVNEKADKLERNVVDYAALAMWDFAGQYIFYTTHQTFLTCHAIYLLVTDLCQLVTDLVKDDECFFDTEGVQLCKVQDLVEVWMN